METQIKFKNNAFHIALTVIVVAALEGFCYLARLPLVIPLILLYLGVHLQFFRKASIKLFMHLGLLLAIVVAGTYAIESYSSISNFYIPVAAVPMLTMLLFVDLQLAFLMAFISSILVGLLTGNEFNLTLIYFLGGLTSVYTVKGARNRGQLILAGFFTGLIQVLCAALLNIEMIQILPQDFLLRYAQPLLFNGVISVFVVMTTSKIFEWLFGVLTNFSLLELSDFNQPLLRQMILEAPGTYHHSLLVSNLAEAAAEAIGANSLLVRVGAYYHDIGKLVKPEYFTENQLATGNVHDDLEPSMSRLVILNHVKEGIELGKKYKLNPMILDFIPQHHGTSIIYYFYQKALEGAEVGETIEEEEFRYPGPKPQTRETAVVLLADSVEGATRAMDEPTPARINDLVRKVINNKFIDGQLDECPLTLKDIEKISVTFSHVLAAMHHGRVKYPEKKANDDNNGRKSAEENPNKSRPNQRERKKDS